YVVFLFILVLFFFFFSSRRRHTRFSRDWSSDVCSSDLGPVMLTVAFAIGSPVSASVTVPDSVPVSSPRDWSTAANASSLPSPHTLLFSGVPPQVRSSVSIAVASSSARAALMSRSSSGTADHINATVPATCGEAIDVPVSAAYPPGTDDRTATAGAEMFGLIRFGSHADGPRPELTYTLPLMSNPPAAYDSGRLPGLDACPHAGPGFPEANCGKIPAATHACTVA